MRFLSICSGIEAASVAWHPLGWEAVAYSEIEPFPCAVLAHHYPNTPNLGDMTLYEKWHDTGSVDLICGGTPCQAFSVAGLRAGLADPRGNLALVFLGIVDRFRPRWVVWENVPGVHSSWSDDAAHSASQESYRTIQAAREAAIAAGLDLGTDFSPGDFEEVDQSNDFDCFIAGLEELGYGVASTILDAQYANLAQRRERVFVVGYLGDWRPPAAVLFDTTCLRWDSPPRRETGQVAPTIPSRSLGGGGLGTDFDCDGGLIAASMTGHGFWNEDAGATSAITNHEGKEPHHLVAGTLQANGKAAGSATQQDAESGMLIAHSLVPVAVPEVAGTLRSGSTNEASHGKLNGTDRMDLIAYRTAGDGAVYEEGDVTAPLTTGTDPSAQILAGAHPPAIAFDSRNRGAEPKVGRPEREPQSMIERVGALDSTKPWNVATAHAVRRLTPRECERLQGFPDDYTLIPYRGKLAADGPRYKALGNSWAVPCARWIGERIQAVEAILSSNITR